MSQYVPPSETVDLFNGAYNKTKDTVTADEFRAIVACYGWLSDDEKVNFPITQADLTPEETKNYTLLGLINKYFPE